MSSASASRWAGNVPLLEIRGLQVDFDTEHGRVHAVRGVSFELDAGRTLGIVGESGCGKSVTLHAILRLTPSNAVLRGEILFQGEPLHAPARGTLERVRGRDIAMIFQEPLSALNPVHTIGSQIAESLRLHRGLDVRTAHGEVLQLLDRVGIPDAARRCHEYPHQLSGGMNQRAMIAMALASNPKLLLADEPTTALDVTIQAQILLLLQDLQRELGMAMVLVTHDLGVVAETADDVAVMYAGMVVERAPALGLFARPAHPYTAALLAALPRIDQARDALEPIEGTLPSAAAEIVGCPFMPRCPVRQARCQHEKPALRQIDRGRQVACHFPVHSTAEAA
jgi:oligopeptide/dipeptide ABC transporter ATP-binding protein